jgi:hypothetical protein
MKSLMNKIWPRLVRGILISFLFAALTACAVGLVKHSFGFDVVSDSPGITVLNYQYGNSQLSATRADISKEQPRAGASVNGEMLRGDFLYVKWRVESTRKVYEDTVDLKTRLPRDITNHEIYFIVKGTQLVVYLITPERRPPDLEPNGPRKTQYLKTLTISSSYGHEVINL